MNALYLIGRNRHYKVCCEKKKFTTSVFVIFKNLVNLIPNISLFFFNYLSNKYIFE